MSYMVNNPICTCPFDPTHRIKQSVLPSHIMKCKKNFMNSSKVVCPFNAAHVIEEMEFKQHVSTCKSSENVISFKYSFEKPKIIGLPVPQIFPPHCFSATENWDKQEYCATYDPWKATENRKILRCLTGATKSERRKFRLTERMRWQRLEEIEELKYEIKDKRRDVKRLLDSNFKGLHLSKKYLQELFSDSKLLCMMELLTIHESDIVNHLNIDTLYISEPDEKKNVQQIIENLLVDKIKKLVLSHI